MPGSGKYCAVFGCNNQEIQKDARSFFRFPRNKPQCDLWVLNCRRADLDVVYKKEGPIKLNNTYKICSDHFLISDFRNPRLFSQGLKPGSIPSQNLPNSSSTTTRRGGLRKRKRDEEVDSDCTVSAPPENELGKLLIVQKDILDNMKVELDSDSEVPLTSLPSDGELCEVIMEEPFAFVSVEHEVDDRVKEKLDSTLTDETHQSCSPPDGEICEVKLEEEPDPFTFVPVKIKMEEGLDVGVMEDKLKCEVTVEEHEERSDGMDVVDVKLILRDDHPLTSLVENDLIAIKQEDESQLVNTQTEDNTVIVKVEPDSDNEDYQTSSLPDGELYEVEKQEKADPLTFFPVGNEVEEGLDVGVMKDEFKCEVTIEEHEGGSDRLLNSALQETDNSRKRKTYCHVCKICGVSCAKSHIVAHAQTPMENYPFKCDICATCYKTRSGLCKHKVIHTADREHKCERCSKTFVKRSALNKHKYIHNTSQKPHVCSVCSKIFLSNRARKEHERIHTGERPFSCEKCDKHYSQNGQLTIHMRTHTGEKPFLCDICNVSFAQKKNLTVHIMLKHSETKPHKCDKCSMSFAINYHLQMHKRVHTGEKPHVCHICNKRFTRKNSLSEHLHTTHSYLHSANRFTCTVCGKRFPRSRNLELHMNTHTGQKPFHCDQCDKSYSSQSTLIKHKRAIHNGIRYCCDICGKNFRGRWDISKHFRKYHDRPCKS